MNEYDSNRIFDITKKINYLKTENLKEADCYILNTCHIREKATEKVYHDVGRIKKAFRGKRKPVGTSFRTRILEPGVAAFSPVGTSFRTGKKFKGRLAVVQPKGP